MPILPTAEQLGSRPVPQSRGGVVPLNLQTPNTGTVEATALANFGQAVQGLGNTFAVLAEKEKRDIDATRTEEASSDYMNGLLQLELGDENGKGGFSNVLSGDAVNNNLPETYRKNREELRTKVREKLSNKDQQVAFDQRANIADRQFDARLYRHVAEQSHTYKAAVYEGALETEQRMAALNWDQPGQLELSILRTNQEVLRKARMDGLDPAREEDRKIIDTLQTIAETKIHSNVINQMLSQGKDVAASDYYNGVKGRLTPEAIAVIGSKVNSASLDGEALRGADRAMEILGPKNINDPVRLDLMEKFVRNEYRNNPTLVKAIISEIRSRAVANNDAQQEVAASNKAVVLDAYHNGLTLKQIQKMSQYQELEGDEKVSVRDYIVGRGWTLQQHARMEAEYADGEKARLGFGKYLELSNPQVLTAMSENQIAALEPTLGRKLTLDLMEKRRHLNTPAKIAAAVMDAELFNVLASDAGLKPYESNKSAPDKEILGRLKNRVETLIDTAQQQVGRTLTREEKEKLMRQEMDRKVVVDGWFTNPKIPAAIVRPEQRNKISVPLNEIDPKWVKGAINYMRSSGAIPVHWTDEKAKQAVRDRLEKGYAHSITGGASEEGKKILEGDAPIRDTQGTKAQRYR